MSSSGTENNDSKYENQISEIIQGELVDLYGSNGYKSIMQTMKKTCGKTEKEILTNYDLFAELAEGVFGRLAESKILEPIKLQIDKIGEENIQQEETPVIKKSMRVLAVDDEPEILDLYKVFLESKGRDVVTATDGKKGVDAYRRNYNPEQPENNFDVVILDQKMPIMTGLQAAVEILDINPQQRIIFASGYLEKTLLDVLTRLNRGIEVIEKPFSLDVLNHMINNTIVFEKLQKLNINQEEKDIEKKMSEIMAVLQS